MRAKILVMLFVVLLVAGSPIFAGDQKPFEGWAQEIGDPDYTINPLDYPYLAEVISENASWTPALVQLVTFNGNNNVGGKSIHENAQLFYFLPLDIDYDPYVLVFYEDSTITVADGDQIFVEVEGIYYSATNTYIATDTVIGGTGRFEGAEGSIKATPGLIKNDQSVVVLEGYITR